MVTTDRAVTVDEGGNLPSGVMEKLDAAYAPLTFAHSRNDGALAAVVDTATDASAALLAFLGTAEKCVLGAGVYFLDSAVEVPATCAVLELETGAVVKTRGNHAALTRTGTITLLENVTASILADSNSITPDTLGLYTVGTWLIVGGDDTLSGTSDKYGWLRQVRSAASDVRVDANFPRSITTMPQTGVVDFAPALHICGDGEITADVDTDVTQPLLWFYAARDAKVTGVEIHHSGGAGIKLEQCLAPHVDAHIHDMLDDGVTHYGYGVNVAGATRNATVLGNIHHVRHAVTTVATAVAITGMGNIGEPESLYMAPTVWACTNKALDTHRPGWGTIIVPNVNGGAGGVQVRADNTHVLPGTITGTSGPGIFVDAVVAIAATISSPVVLATRTPGYGIQLNGPAVVSNPVIRNAYVAGIGVFANDVQITGGVVKGSATGVEIGTGISGTRIRGMRVDTCTTGLTEAAGATDNRWEIEYVSCGTKETVTPTYTHASILRNGLWRVEATPFVGTTETGTWVTTPDSASAFAGYRQSAVQNDAIQWQLALDPGTWSIFVLHRSGGDKGIANVQIDGASAGTVDMYSGVGTRNATGSVTGAVVSAPGRHLVKLLMATKNGSSSGYLAMVQQVVAIRTV